MPVMIEGSSGKGRQKPQTRERGLKRPDDNSKMLRTLSPAVRVRSLSPAELEVVQEMVVGLSPKEVATKRGTSIATVRTQLKRAKKKTAARTLNELVALVCMAGLEESADD